MQSLKALLPLAFLTVLVESVAFGEVKVKKVETEFPKKELAAVASGSGIIIGPHLILTNRHVVAADDGDPSDGFRILLGPDYKKGLDGKAVWICENYDLALIETKNALSVQDVLLLDGLPPLGTKVTAYGFPLGSEFGIGLTATGGQITREPAIAAGGDSPHTDADRIRTSMWHDAKTSHGSSGGPLFTEHGVLVGLHFGSLKEEGGHGMAVPPLEIASFLRQTSSEAHVKFVSSRELGQLDSKVLPTDVTVYIEVLGRAAGAKAKVPQKGTLARVRGTLQTKISSALPDLSESELRLLEAGDLTPVFKPSNATDVHSGEVANSRQNGCHPVFG